MVQTWMRNMKAHGTTQKNKKAHSRILARPEPYSFSPDLTFDQELEIVAKAVELNSPTEGLREWMKINYPDEAEKHYQYRDWDMCFIHRKTVSDWVNTFKDIGFHRLGNHSTRAQSDELIRYTDTPCSVKCETVEDDLSIKIEEVDADSIKCYECNYICPTQDELNSHIYQNHGERTIQCEECRRMFQTKDLLQKHHIKSGHWPRKFPCELCDKRFTTSRGLREHVRRVHYMCQICDASYQVKYNYEWSTFKLSVIGCSRMVPIFV